MNGLNRRSFLKGLSARVAVPAMVSLPGFKSAHAMGHSIAKRAAGTTASGAPLRTAFVYFPNGAIEKTWWPDSRDSPEKNAADTPQGGLKLSPTLSPFQSLKDSIQIHKGLNMEPAEEGRDGAGDHARGNGTFLTAVRLRKSATRIRAGVSIDQVIASQIGDQTRFRSLELTCDANRRSGECDSGYSCAYQYNIAWRSATTPMIPEANPRLVFERLFGAGAPEQRQARFRQRLDQQKSVLDFVLADARRMKRRLQQSDRYKLDEYLSSVRSIESRIQWAERHKVPDTTNETTPGGIPEQYSKHIELMFDLMRLAFQTDSTRVCTFSLAHDGSNRSFNEIGIHEGHHELSHHKYNKNKIKKISQIDLFYTRQFAKFLSSLKEIEDIDGNSLLQNSMIVYGSGNADGNRHTHKNLPVLLAGHGGGSIDSGRMLNHGSQPLSNLYLSMADRMGGESLKRFGDSTGRLNDV